MKRFIFAALFTLIAATAYAANTGWDPKPDGVHAKSPAIPLFLNQTGIDALSPTAGSIVHNVTESRNEWYDGVEWLRFFDGKGVFGALADDNTDLGTPYNLTTSFQTYTSYDTVNNSSDISVSTSAGTITLDADGGEYDIQVNIAVTAVGGPGLEFGLFLNLTTEIGSFTREIRGVHHHPPILINLSSNAAYNTYSTVDRLAFRDSDEIWIDEASAGASPLLFDMTFNDEILYPTNVEFFGVLYDGATAHEVEAKMWNYSTSAYVDMRGEIKDFPDSAGTDPFRYYDREFGVPDPISSYVDIGSKTAIVRIDHTSTGSPGHQFRIDKVQLHDSHNSAAISFDRILTVPGGSVISVKVKSDLELPAYFVNMHLHVIKVSN